MYGRASYAYSVVTEDNKIVGTVAGNYAEIDGDPYAFLYVEGDDGFLTGKFAIPEDGYVVRAVLDSDGNRILEEVEIIWPLEIDEDSY